MQITRYVSLSEMEFLGCTSAFVDTLSGELNSAAMYLRKLEGQVKGAAFAYEMSLDRHRYSALMVLDRWAELIRTFGEHVNTQRYRAVIEDAPGRVAAAENLLGRTNQVIDAAERYSDEVVNASLAAFQAVNLTFAEERGAAESSQRLGPMLPEDFKQARRTFLGDLSAR